jgi:beta-xylosidase
MKRSTLSIIVTLLSCLTPVRVQAEPARNPIIWADVPDVAVIRVGDTYYMSSTTMHMSPGLPS